MYKNNTSMASLTSSEKEAIEQIIEYGIDTFGFNTTRVLPLTLVLLGERDGCLIGVTEKEEAEFLEDTLSNAGISFNKDTSKNYRFFIAKSDSHLTKNSVGEGRPDGEFFGYPDDSIEFYCSSSDPVKEFEEFMRNSSSHSFESWGDKTPLIEYIPAPTEESVEQALEREKSYENALRSASVDLSNAHDYRF